MKLLVISDSFLPRWDGVSRFLDDLIPNLSRAFRLSVIAPKFQGIPAEYPKAKILYMDTRKFSIGGYHLPKRNTNLIKKEIMAADVIFTQTIGPLGAYAIRYAHRKQKKIVAFTHSIEWELVSNYIVRTEWVKKGVHHLTKSYAQRHYNKCSHLIVPSDEIQRKLERAGITTPLTVVHLGTNTLKFKPPKNKRTAKQLIGIDTDKFVIGYTGRISKEKDLMTLRDAFVHLRERYKNIVLVIVGEGNKKQESELKGEGIERFGRSDNVSKYLQAMDVYVLPSLTETSSLSTMEAMSTGLAVVATKVGHLQHYIKDGHSGYFMKKNDSRLLAARLEYLLHHPLKRRDVGKAARKMIRDNYNWSSASRKIIALLKNQGKN